MDKAILYIHGKGGNPKEAEYYKALFEEYDVIGFDYSSQSPWEAKKEFPRLFDNLCGTYETVTVIANSRTLAGGLASRYQHRCMAVYAGIAENAAGKGSACLTCGGHGRPHHPYDAVGECDRR